MALFNLPIQNPSQHSFMTAVHYEPKADGSYQEKVKATITEFGGVNKFKLWHGLGDPMNKAHQLPWAKAFEGKAAELFTKENLIKMNAGIKYVDSVKQDQEGLFEVKFKKFYPGAAPSREQMAQDISYGVRFLAPNKVTVHQYKGFNEEKASNAIEIGTAKNSDLRILYDAAYTALENDKKLALWHRAA